MSKKITIEVPFYRVVVWKDEIIGTCLEGMQENCGGTLRACGTDRLSFLGKCSKCGKISKVCAKSVARG